jgi:hypothetical protein
MDAMLVSCDEKIMGDSAAVVAGAMVEMRAFCAVCERQERKRRKRMKNSGDKYERKGENSIPKRIQILYSKGTVGSRCTYV